MQNTRDQDLFTTNINQNLRLEGTHVILEAMTMDHIEGLNKAADDGELWKLKVTSVPRAKDMKTVVQKAITQGEKGQQVPFVVRRKHDGDVVGSTRFYNISARNRNLSIGYTWYSQSVHRTAINTECKLLLLSHAFEKAACISVQWHTHHENTKSQKAILRLGAKLEGVLRNHQILDDGRIRHTHCFSMLDEEWPASKLFLQQRLAAHA